MQIKKGATRTVFIFWRFAVKVPLAESWKTFLTGLLCNIQETEFSPLSDRLCPIAWSAPLGLMVVMPRCTPLSYELQDSEFEDFVSQGELTLPVENKKSSFGWIGDRMVAVDYGS